MSNLKTNMAANGQFFKIFELCFKEIGRLTN